MKTLTIILSGVLLAIITFAKLPATKAENSTESGITFH
jgi:hypothetical protein